MNDECPICKSNFKFPIKLGCGHEFCYLCLKASLRLNNNCPYCRQDTVPPKINEEAKFPDDQKLEIPVIIWIYSGRNNGWWYYDLDTNLELETKYTEYLKDKNKFERKVWLLSKPYQINFITMTQISDDIHSNIRKIKRIDTSVESIDTFNKLIKGIAGLQIKSKD